MKNVTPYLISLAVAIIFSIIHIRIESTSVQDTPFSAYGPIRELDRSALDFKFSSQTLDEMPEAQVVVAGIDEKAIEKYGQFPWPRSLIGDFIRTAGEGGASVIAFDVAFVDEDRSNVRPSVRRIRQTLLDSQLGPDGDLAALEASIKKTLTKKERERLLPLIEGLRDSSRSFLSRLDDEIGAKTPDELLAASVKEYQDKTVLGFMGYSNTEDFIDLTEDDMKILEKDARRYSIDTVYDPTVMLIGDQEVDKFTPASRPIESLQIPNVDWVGFHLPLSILRKEAAYIGSFNAFPDPDGPLRSVPLVFRYKDFLMPSLSAQSAALFNESPIEPVLLQSSGIIESEALEGVNLGGFETVPTDREGRLLVRYYSKPEEFFPTFSIASFLDGSVDPSLYEGKVILVGMTALGLYDLRPNPFSPTTPGVYIHAMAIQNILDELFLQRPPLAAVWEVLAYILLSLFLAFSIPKLRPYLALLELIAVIAGIYIIDQLVLFPQGYWVLIVYPSLMCVTVFLCLTVYGYLTEGREKGEIRKAFQYYLSKNVVDQVLTDPQELQLGGKKARCTVLFSDIRGFTTISEQLDAKALSELLNEYLTPMTNVVFNNNGTLDKYMGDAIMAFFGAPIEHDNHAVEGCYTALEMMEELAVLQEGWAKSGTFSLDVGIGLNTGDMSVGNMGSRIRFDYTVMGDNVNLGSRLEGINKEYRTNIIISESTFEGAKDFIHAREMDLVRVKGKREPVRIYELIGKGPPTSNAKALIEHFGNALLLYRQQRWDEAIAAFDHVRTEIKLDDGPSSMYIQRCQELKLAPPGEFWDGTYTMTTK